MGTPVSVVVIVYPWLKPWVRYESSATADLTVDGYQIMFSPWLKPWVRYESSAAVDWEMDDGSYWFYLPSIVLPFL
jgi:hypothetical protein